MRAPASRARRSATTLIDQAGADRDRVGGMCFRAVALGDCRCDAALGPGGRCALSERRRRNHGDRARRQP
jgi:hypothetical protein